MTKVARSSNLLRDDVPTSSASQASLDAIRTLFRGLNAREREQIFREILRQVRPIAAPQAGEVLGTLLQLMPRDRDFSVAELKSSISKQDASATAKEIHNAIGYLTRKKHIRRIGYGRYVVDGVPYISSDDFGGERSITEGDLDD
jgi:hypothetical protein